MGAPAVQRPRFLRFPGVARRPRPAPPRRPGPTPAGAALRSATVPGWGQWASHRRLRGALFLGATAAVLLLPLAALLAALYPLLPLLSLALPEAVGQTLGATGAALAWLARPLEGLFRDADWTLLGWLVLALNGAVLLVRGWATLDAAGCARRARARFTALRPAATADAPPAGASAPGARRALPLLAGGLATVLVLSPHVAFVAGALALQPLLAQVLRPTPARAAPPPAAPAPEPTPSDPFAAVQAQLPPPDGARPLWDGRSPLNVLLLGTDRRPRDAALGQWGNSDTIVLVSVDPVRQQATMISVPRDFQVEGIPGVGREKVNAAYRMGGPDLAVRVVGDLLGVPIHRWASVDVSAFARMIDAVGGVVVDLERPVRDDEFPNEDYSVRRILLPAGLQWLDGERALWYARSRHSSTDFDRADRQQRLLLSLKGRARDPAVVPRIPPLIVSLADAVQTDVSPREAISLASLGVKSDFKSVRGLVLTPPDYGTIINRPDLFAIVPNRERIRRDVAALLAADPSAPTPQAPPPAARSLSDLPVDAAVSGEAEEPERPAPAPVPAPAGTPATPTPALAPR